MDKPNSRLIGSPLEIICRSLLCLSECKPKFAQMGGFLLGFGEFGGRNLHLFLMPIKDTDEINLLRVQMLRD